MKELIHINYDSDTPTVSARALHEFLEVGTRYSDWFPRMCEYGFTEGGDYHSFLSNRSDGLPGKPAQDAALTGGFFIVSGELSVCRDRSCFPLFHVLNTDCATPVSFETR